MPREVIASAPGRVNLIGEHTDYNGGLALAFAIAEGVSVHARATASRDDAARRIRVRARDLDEDDEFPLEHPARTGDWRSFARGIAAELTAAGVALPGAELEIHGDVPRGAGLSSSAALEVALALALLALAGAQLDAVALARLCSRVENDWVGARTGLLDQLASLLGARDVALLIDFSDLSSVERVPLVLARGWRLATVDSGERRALAGVGYNERRAECARACALLSVRTLREAHREDAMRLPAPLARRVSHVLDENARALDAVAALRAADLPRLGALLDASHASLRDQYEISTPAIEETVERLRRAGAAGARILGGGFGGSVLALLPPTAPTPADAHEVRPSRGAHARRVCA